MPELSNLLRQRLGLRETPGTPREIPDCGTVNGDSAGSVARSAAHPDADSLTAYAERLLHVDERDRILRHLASCGQCRDIVLLSLPEVETAAKAAAAGPVARGWRAMFTPGLGLAASAVAAALVVGLIVEAPWRPTPTAQKAVQPPGDNSTANTANLEAGSKQIPAPPAASLVPSSPASLSSNPSFLDSNELRPGARRTEARRATPAMSDLDGKIASGDRGREAREIYDLRTTASSVASAPPASIAGVVTGERRDYLNAAIFADASTSHGSAAGESSAGAKKDLPTAPAPRAASAWNTIPSTQIPDFAQLTSAPGVADRHTFAPPRPPGRSFVGVLISPAKNLFQKQPPLSARALGFNNTMGVQLNPARDKSQSVEVAAAPALGTEAGLAESQAFSDRARSKALGIADGEYGAQSSSWKVAGGKLLKKGEAGSWAEAYPGESIEFSTFVAHGPDVWAGGHDAALIHSNDGGTTWERITLGSAASGTIVKIEAKGLNVQVLSSSGQSWTSVDGGKTWARED